MKKIILLLLLLCLCACKEKITIKLTTTGFTSEFIGSIERLNELVGGDAHTLYRCNEKDYCVATWTATQKKYYILDIESKQIIETKEPTTSTPYDPAFYQNDEFTIKVENEHNSTHFITNWYLITNDKTTLLYKEIYEANTFNGRSQIISNITNNIPYLGILNDDKYIVYEVTVDGLKEIYQTPLTIGEYTLEDNHLGQYSFYRGKKDFLLVVDDHEYHTNLCNIDIFNELIFLWEESFKQIPTSTKIINSNTQKEIELDYPIGIDQIQENYFIGYQQKGEHQYYTIGTFKDNVLTLIETPFIYEPNSYFSSTQATNTAFIPLNETQILVYVLDENTYNYYLITLE